jgi:uroporphyrinogen-III decarboxylase
MKNIPNYILSTGCDLPLEVPEENVTAFMVAGSR